MDAYLYWKIAKMRNRLKISMETNRKLMRQGFALEVHDRLAQAVCVIIKNYKLYPNSHETVLELLKMRQLFFLIPFREKLETVDSC
jgi:hypothetical protein